MERAILGENCIFSTDCAETGLNNNILVCGTSGCGKTMSITEPRLLETFDTNLIVTVTKRRIVDKYKPMFAQRGYRVWDLNFVHPSEGNVAYDPLAFISSYQDITFLARSLVEADPRKDNSTADPYWDEAATSLLSAEIAYTLMTNENATFADVLDFHSTLSFTERNGQIDTSLDDKFARLERAAPGCFAVSCWNSFKRLPIKTASCVFSALNTTIDTIFNPELKKMISAERKMDFCDFASAKTVMFITTSPVNPALNCFINIFYSSVFKELFEYAESQPDGALPIATHVICDDFATGGRILNFAEYISIFREKKISVTLLLQSESQLESMYRSVDATTIINNCDTYVYMGGMDLKTAQNVSLRLNRPLEDVLYLPVGEIAVFRRGQRPVMTRRYNILQNEMYQQITEQHLRKIANESR